jgi:type III secretion protein C
MKLLRITQVLFFVLALSPINFTNAQNTSPTQLYIANGESPREVLSYLLGLFGKEFAGGRLPSKPVNGKFKVSSVNEVMSYFEKAYNVSWFEFGSNIYLYSPSDWSTKRIYVGDFDNTVDWNEMLQKVGLLQPKFSILYKRDAKELIVTSPNTYYQFLRNAFEIERPPEVVQPDNKPVLMVFPLKYASVEDRTFNLRGTPYTTKGVYSVIRELLGDELNKKNNRDKDFKGDPSMKAARQMVSKSVRGSDAVDKKDSKGVPTLGSSADVANTSPNKEEAEWLDRHEELGMISADVRTNSILIRDSEDKREFYQSVVNRVDVPVSMIEVEAMLVEIDSGTLNQLGLEFGIQGAFQYQFPNTDRFAAGTNPFTGGSSIVTPDKFIARLRALQSENQAKVLARPTIVTQDNVSAFIDLSETLYIQIQGERVAEVVPITAGSLLQVTPRLLPDGSDNQIFVNIEIQDGAILKENNRANPTIRNTTLSTQAVINRDKAILIGGYNREVHSEVEHKVPVLSNLPMVGRAFTSKEKETKNFVRLFMITPRIIDQPTFYANSTRTAAKKINDTFNPNAPELNISSEKPLQIDQQTTTGQ